jgi:type II secretory pathway component GspD/PulD (secretin)
MTHFKKMFKLKLLFSAALVILAAARIGAVEEENPAQEKSIHLAQVPLVAPLSLPSDAGLEFRDRITLDLRNIDIVDALKFLATKAGLNIIASKAVSGRVTLMVENAPIQDVFDVMLRSNNLAFDTQGEIYNVMTQEEYRALYGKNYSDVRQVKVFYLKYVIPEQAFSLLDMLKSDVGRVLVDPESGNVLVMDSPAKIETMENVLKEFEEKNTVRIFKLNYAKAKDVEDALKIQLDSKKVGLIKADDKSNQVMVQTLPERMEQIAGLVSQLDQKTKEIIVDVNIINVKLSDDLSQGIQWEGLFNMGSKYGLGYLGSYPFSSVQAANDAWRSRQATYEAVGNVGSYPFSGTSTSYSASRPRVATEEMHLGIVGRNDFDTVLKYLQTLGKTKIISNPKLAVVNNQEAKIHVGQKEAYVTTTTTTGQTTNTVSEQVTFVDVGVMISVVPNINDDGFISLKIKAEINSVIDTLITPTKNQIPIIDTSLAETTVMVKDGSTVIIGGLRKEQEVESTTQTPFFGSIPFLGNLFKVKSKQKDRTELLLILTPRIITGEVLVTGADKKDLPVGPFKPAKDYLDLKKEAYVEEPTVLRLKSVNEKQGLEFKGPKAMAR